MFQQKSRLDTFLRFGYLTALSSQFLRLFSLLPSQLAPDLRVNRAICNWFPLECSSLSDRRAARLSEPMFKNHDEVRHAMLQ